MKKFATAAAFLIASFHINGTSTEEKTASSNSYKYLKASDQWAIFPGLGVGYRLHNQGCHGFNFDLTTYSYWDTGFSLYSKAHYLFYPNQNHLYLGLGSGVIGGYCSPHFGGGPLIQGAVRNGFFIKPTLEGIIGYEWNTEKRPLFLQLEIGGSYGDVPLYPVVSFGIGF